MLKRFSLLALAMAGLVFVATQAPSHAALIDKVVIQNETSDGTVEYDITGPHVGTHGCIRHRQSFSDGYLVKPLRVTIKVMGPGIFVCPGGHAIYTNTFNYWQPLTTYTVTGSPHYKDIKVATHH